MYFELKAVNVWTMIKVWFFLNLIIGLGMGLVYLFISMLTVVAAGELLLLKTGLDPQAMSPSTFLLLLPIAFALGHAVFGTILVAVLSLVYNITARLFGGLQFEAVPDEDNEEKSEVSESVPPLPAATIAEHDSPYAPPPPPPPPLGLARAQAIVPPLGAAGPMADSPGRRSAPPESSDAEPSGPDESNEPPESTESVDHETPTLDWPMPPSPPAQDNNDTPENRP